MIKITAEHFSLAQICRSGQCFRMSEREENVYEIIAGDRYLEAGQQGEECWFDCEEAEYHNFWKRYFDLEQDYGAYIEQINPNDAYLRVAAEYGSGIRILRQELWEMIVTFLISQQNNIVRIRRCIENICECYGETCVNRRGEIYYSFPTPEALAHLGDDDLKACNLGYRSKYVVRAARSVVAGTMLSENADSQAERGSTGRLKVETMLSENADSQTERGSTGRLKVETMLSENADSQTERGLSDRLKVEGVLSENPDLQARNACSGGINLAALSGMPYKKARAELLRLFGVGEKVADCICLFALHHLDAFPVDTHIQQAMQAHYRRGFPNRRYRGFRGVMQQYIFYYELFGKKERATSNIKQREGNDPTFSCTNICK